MYSASYFHTTIQIRIDIRDLTEFTPNQVHIYILQKDGPYQQHLWLGYNIAIYLICNYLVIHLLWMSPCDIAFKLGNTGV